MLRQVYRPLSRAWPTQFGIWRSARCFATTGKQDQQGTKSGDRAVGATEFGNQDVQATKPEDSAVEATEFEKLSTLVAEKDEKIAELNDRALRVLAEMENVRAIARRDVDNAKKYGIVGFAKGLLGVADNLGLALNSVPEELASNKSEDPQFSGLYFGVKATESELLKVFSQHGLVPYGKVGEKFDPKLHQAMFEAPVANVEPGTIMEVTKVGYSIGDRILRPAEVGVSKAM